MKKLHYLILLLTVLFAGCNFKNKQITITGTIIDDDKTELFYSAIVNDAYNGWFRSSVIPDSMGHFEITMDSNQPCFSYLLYKSSYTPVVLEPEGVYNIEINAKTKEVKFISEKSEAQKYYETLPTEHPNGVNFFKKDVSDYKDILADLQERLNNEYQGLREVKCSEGVKNLIKADRQAYYNIAISSLASRNNVAFLRKKEITPNDVMKMWENAVNDSLLANSLIKKSYHYYDLLGQAFWFNLFSKLDYDSISVIRKEKRNENLIHTYNIELSKTLLPSEISEYYFASYVQSGAGQNKYEKEFIDLFNHFKTDYPKSKYIDYITPNIDKIVDFHNKVAAEFNNDCIFIDDYKNLNTLENCLLSFKGKKIYVDIWSTSCGPCKREFKHNYELKELLKNNDVEMLYISLDKENYDQRWKDMIKYYELNGNHIRANANLKADLRAKFGNFGIPRYLLIDENGKIINKKAPRPSNLIALKKLL